MIQHGFFFHRLGGAAVSRFHTPLPAPPPPLPDREIFAIYRVYFKISTFS